MPLFVPEERLSIQERLCVGEPDVAKLSTVHRCSDIEGVERGVSRRRLRLVARAPSEVREGVV